MSFQALARLLQPADGTPSIVIETDPGWTLDRAAAPSWPASLIWGRGPAPSGTAATQLVRGAVARERALLALRFRRPAGHRVSGVHRWPPPRLVSGQARNRLRDAVLGGAIVELERDRPARRILDAAAQAAGHAGRVERFKVGSGGSALVTLDSEAPRGILRVAQAGHPADPGHAGAALERLSPLGLGLVPQLLGRGIASGASWTQESILAGRRPDRVSPAIGAQVAAFCARLPHATSGPTAFEADLEAIAAAFPAWRGELATLRARFEPLLATLPMVMRHGDLWAGNLLVEGDRLTGIIDWDSWHSASAPGTDLLHLLAAETALLSRREIGQVWLDRPWTSAAFNSVSAGYWAALGVRPDSRRLDAIGVAWWAAEIRHALELAPEQAGDLRWVELNVEAVVRQRS